MVTKFPRSRVFARLGAGLFALLFVANLHAQNNASQATDRVELVRTQASLRDEPESTQSGTDDSHAVATPNDPDLGEQAILKRSDAYLPWTVAVSAPISYTSNVALTRNNEEGDALFAPNVTVVYAPRIKGTLFATFSVSQQYFYYGRLTEFDFGSFDARAGLTYTAPRLHNLFLRAEYNFNRLTEGSGFDEFFSNHAINLGAELPFQIGRAQQFSAGLDLNFSLAADPDEPQRHDYSFYLGYSANLTRALTLNATARLAVRDYLEGDRTDVSGIFAVGATYRFTKWFSASLVSSFATNDSNRDVFDYDVVNIGGALAVTFRF